MPDTTQQTAQSVFNNFPEEARKSRETIDDVFRRIPRRALKNLGPPEDDLEFGKLIRAL